MSHLTVYADSDPAHPRLRTSDPSAIEAAVKAVGARFERWQFPMELSVEDSSETILEAFRPHLDTLMGETGAGSADVMRLAGTSEAYPAIRAKFLAEHTHSEDEVRFFVHGSGNFVLHANGEVYDLHCERGDLVFVPAGVKHWFDAGEQPFFTVLRVFTDTSGWTPHYTGDRISELFPVS